MNFASYDFWQTLLLCFVASRLVLAAVRAWKPGLEGGAGRLCLLATALTLLATESWLTLACFVWVVMLGWFALLLRGGPGAPRPGPARQVAFALLLLAQLAPLFYYKYWDFALNEVLGLGVRVPSVLIPMGLSFYTFQILAFWLDHHRRPEPRPSFLDYLNFASFFPQIVAGPIETRESLLPQVRQVRFRIHRENLDAALKWIVLGLAYKMIVADNLGSLMSGMRVDAASAWQVWFECLAFGMRIYFDFAGYSFVAVGLGLLFGIHLTLNFRCPYWSRDLREFWRNWHVSLGAWLRNQIYLPLGGRRVKWWMLNIVIVFVVSGIWHGAGWGFLIWGLLHGLGVAVCGLRANWLRFPPLQWAMTFTFTTAVWLFFLERDPALLWQKASSLVQPAAYHLSGLRAIPTIFANLTDALAAAVVLVLAGLALAIEGMGLRGGTREPYHFLRHPVSAVLLVFLIVLLAPMEEAQFIYFNF